MNTQDNCGLYRRSRGLWVCGLTADLPVETLEGKAQLNWRTDAYCWRSETDVWPQPWSTLEQSYAPTTNRRQIPIRELGNQVHAFTEYVPKTDVFIIVRAPKPGETSIVVNNNRLNVDCEEDLIAQRLDGTGAPVGEEYPIKQTILAVNFQPA